MFMCYVLLNNASLDDIMYFRSLAENESSTSSRDGSWAQGVFLWAIGGSPSEPSPSGGEQHNKYLSSFNQGACLLFFLVLYKVLYIVIRV